MNVWTLRIHRQRWCGAIFYGPCIEIFAHQWFAGPVSPWCSDDPFHLHWLSICHPLTPLRWVSLSFPVLPIQTPDRCCGHAHWGRPIYCRLGKSEVWLSPQWKWTTWNSLSVDENQRSISMTCNHCQRVSWFQHSIEDEVWHLSLKNNLRNLSVNWIPVYLHVACCSFSLGLHDPILSMTQHIIQSHIILCNLILTLYLCQGYHFVQPIYYV